jgi:selenocysteine lyase/cysteine desulfurase
MAGAAASVAETHRLPTTGPLAWPVADGMVVTSHVDAGTGAVLDVGGRADAVHAMGGSLMVDMGWSAGATPVDAPASGADLVLVDLHRWLLGPEGVTAVWASDPTTAARLRTLVDPLPSALLVGVARSVGWLLMYLGLPWAFDRVEGLTRRLRAALGAIDGVTLGDGSSGMAAALPLTVAGWAADEVATELARRAHAHVEVDGSRGLLVASVGAWTREEEVDRFADAVAELAAHTPETLPRRPVLTVLAPMPTDDR